jgi:hypothetical protein
MAMATRTSCWILRNGVRAAPRRVQRGLVDEVREIGAGKAWGVRRRLVEVHVRGERHAAGVHCEDRAPRAELWTIDDDATIEAPRSQERRIEHVGAVGCRQHDREVVA